MVCALNKKGWTFVKLLTTTIKPYHLDAMMEKLLDIDVMEIRVFDYKSYASARAHTEVFRGQERRVALVPKIQIQILAEPDNLIKADEIVKSFRSETDDDEDIAFVSDVILV